MSLTVDQPREAPADLAAGDPSGRSTLYRLAGVSAAVAALVTPIVIAVFTIWPPPYDESAEEWFRLYRDNPWLGLMSLDLGLVIVSALLIPVVLGICVALRRTLPALVATAGAVYLVSVAAYFATNTTFEMLSLSSRYAGAATDAERVALLGAGEAMLATFDGTAFHVYYVLGQLAGIALGIIMLRTHLFGRAIPYLMVGGNAFGFLLYVPEVGLALSALSGVILWMWMVIIAPRFFGLAHEEIRAERMGVRI